MPYHTQNLFKEILRLYSLILDRNEISLKMLEEAFYAFVYVINIKEELNISLDFETELNKLLEYDNFSADQEYLYFEDIFEDLNYESEDTPIDYYLDEYVYNIQIIHRLHLNNSYESTIELFNINLEIIRLFLELGQIEYLNGDNKNTLTLLKEKLRDLKTAMMEIDDKTLAELKIVFAYKNYQHLLDHDDDYINYNWNIALFSDNESQIVALTYDRLEYLCDISYDSQDEDDLNEEYVSDEASMFLNCLFFNICDYLKKYPNNPGLESLVIKKYLLLSVPELSNTLLFMLDNGFLPEEAPTFNKDWLTKESFSEFKTRTYACALDFFEADQSLTKNHIYGRMIINALFIRTYLNCIIDQNLQKELINILTNNRFYKEKNYSICTHIIDDLILYNRKDYIR